MQKKLANLCKLILSDKNTRNLLFFLVLNLIFAFVELSYGLWTNSLGLISDSFHMFFDCSALLLGLAASIVAKWKPNDKFTYGFGRAEILAGLANGLFLLFIALFIMKEAVERTFEPPEVHHERLFVISVLGFLVNLIGIFVFQHGGQGHHHHGGGCSHSHAPQTNSSKTMQDVEYKYDSAHGYSHYSSPTVRVDPIYSSGGAVALEMNGHVAAQAGYGPSSSSIDGNANHQNHNHHHHNHHHNHHQHDGANHFNEHSSDNDVLIEDSNSRLGRKHSSGRGQIMQSVLLHIIADTLGSVGVMISAVLMSQFGWLIADPICSLFIAILISISVYPLLRDAIYILMQRIPVELEKKLPDCLYKIQNLKGILNVHDAHVWTLNSDTYIGCLKLEIKQDADYRHILGTTKKLLNSIGVERANIQIDYV